jgi:hypothetical protein
MEMVLADAQMQIKYHQILQGTKIFRQRNRPPSVASAFLG